jgi:hypothetical protein
MRWVVYIVTALIVAYLGAVLHVWAKAGMWWLVALISAATFYIAWLIDQRAKHRPPVADWLREDDEPPAQQLEPDYQSTAYQRHIGEDRGQSHRARLLAPPASALHPQLRERVLN